MTVVYLNQTEATDGPHVTGEAECGACGHRWTAIAPLGTPPSRLECPNCDRIWGHMRAHVIPPAHQWTCGCGNDLYWLTPDGAMCRGCGLIETDWAD